MRTISAFPGPVLAIAGLIVFVLGTSIASGLGAPTPDADRQMVIGLLVGYATGYGGTIVKRAPRATKGDGPVIGE